MTPPPPRHPRFDLENALRHWQTRNATLHETDHQQQKAKTKSTTRCDDKQYFVEDDKTSESAMGRGMGGGERREELRLRLGAFPACSVIQ